MYTPSSYLWCRTARKVQAVEAPVRALVHLHVARTVHKVLLVQTDVVAFQLAEKIENKKWRVC